MAIEKCPCCERDFQGITDYPKIFISYFEPRKLPNTRYPVHMGGLFVDLDSNSINKKLPEPVKKIFNETRKDLVDFNGWQWIQREYTRENTYELANDDSTGIISKIINYRIEKYFEKLNGVLGEEIPSGGVIPPEMPGHYALLFDSFRGQNVDRVGLDLVSIGSGRLASIDHIAQVAILGYEGRLNPH